MQTVIKNKVKAHTCNGEDSRIELEGAGIKADILPIPNHNIGELVGIPMPDKFTIAWYCPNDHYYENLIVPVAGMFTDIGFYILGRNVPETIVIGNIQIIPNFQPGNDNRRAMLAEVNAVIRVTKHDAMPKGLREAAVARRHIITNYKLEKDGGFIDTIEPTLADAAKAIVELKTGNKFRELASLSLSNYWIQKSNNVRYQQEIDKLFSKLW